MQHQPYLILHSVRILTTLHVEGIGKTKMTVTRMESALEVRSRYILTRIQDDITHANYDYL